MKRFSRILAGVALCALACFVSAGCHAQLPVSSPKVALTWTAPVATSTWSGCMSSAPCTYVVLRAAVATAATKCPDNTGTSYTQIGTSTTLALTDAAVSQGGYYCWIVQAEQGTPAITGSPSTPSNGGVALAVPGVPTAPGAPGATTQVSEITLPQVRPVLSGLQVASLDKRTMAAPIQLTARMIYPAR